MIEKLQKLKDNHLFMSAVYKSISGLSLFVSMPMLISYLGTENYGLWILVFTLFQWVLLMDFGLASVLKTKIPELKHTGNVSLINAYIKSTYKICCYIALAIFLVFLLVFMLFDIGDLLNISLENGFVTKLFLLNIFFFCVNFVLNTHKSLFVGVHKGKFAEQSIAVNQITFLFILAFALWQFPSISVEAKLYLISFINGFVCLAVNFGYSVYFFKSEHLTLATKEQTPKDYLSQIYRLGFKYMVIQLGILFLFSSDNYILSYFFSPKDIVPYEIITKYFQFPLMILIAGMAPLWSLFAKHYLENDKAWLQMSFRKFNYFYLLIVTGMALCVLIAPMIIKIWISKDFVVSQFLLVAIAVMTSLRIFTTFYSYFFNGIGNLRSYLLLLSVSVIVKIPLSYLFIKMNFGISSVALASIACLIVWSIVQPADAYKIVSKIKNRNPE